MRLRLLTYFCTVFLLFISPFLKAQKQSFTNYTLEDGLPQNTVFDIAEDDRGFVWFATQIGVARFDGKNFKTYTIKDGLPGNYVKSLFADKDGHVWLGTRNGGIAKITPRGVETILEENTLSSSEIGKITQDRFSRVIAATAGDGLMVFASDTLVRHLGQEALRHPYILDVLTTNTEIWVGTIEGVHVFSLNSLDSLEYYTMGKEAIRGFEMTPDSTIWAATQGNGLYSFHGNATTHIDTAKGLSSNTIVSLEADSQGKLWFGYYPRGVGVLDGKLVNNYFTDETGEDNLIARSVFEDSRGRIWILTYGMGIVLYEHNHFFHYTSEHNLVDNTPLAFFEDSQQNIWLGTTNGVSKLGKGLFEIFDKESGVAMKTKAVEMFGGEKLKDNDILSLEAHPSGDIWLGSYKSLMRYDGYRFVDYTSSFWEYSDVVRSDERKETSDFPPPSALFTAMDNSIWIGTQKGGIYNWSDGRFIYGNVPDEGRKFGRVNDIAQDRDGNIWIGTDSGLVVKEEELYTYFKVQDGLLSDKVDCILIHDRRLFAGTEKGLSILNISNFTFDSLTTTSGLPVSNCEDIVLDPSGRIWLATLGGGVCLINKEDNERYRVKTFGIDEGLASDNIYSLVLDDQGLLWLGHEKGLNTLDIENFSVRYFGREEGFTPLDNYSRSVTKDHRGDLWFGTMEGLVHLETENNQLNLSPPQSILTGISLYGEQQEGFAEWSEGRSIETGLPVELVLPYNQNYLTFHCAANHMVLPDKNLISVKLEGFDPEWTAPSTEREYEYKKLPPKNYTFLIRSANSDGVWNEEPFRYSFRIKPPFWKTPWFYALELLALLGLIYAFIKYRERQLVREKRILEEKVQERTREIAKQKEEIELQRDEIATKNQEITDSIHYAKRIQNAILPGKEEMKRMLPEHFIFFRPRDIVSGDFFWVNEFGSKVIAVAADCTGHGVPGAFMSMLGVTLLNETVNKDKITRADQILGQLRDYIKQTLSQTGKEGESKDGMDLALTIIDKENNTVEYSGAYNPLILVRNGKITEIKADKMPIGIHLRDKQPFTMHRLDVQPGDLVYTFSDGYPDQFGGEKGMKYKILPFKRLLVNISTLPMEEQEQALADELDRWMGAEEQVDDIIVMGVKIT